MNGCVLEKIDLQKDSLYLYRAMTNEDQYLHSTTLHFSSFRHFEHWIAERLKTDFHDFYIIRNLSDNTPIGYVYDYAFSLEHGHCKLVTYINPEYRGSGIGGYSAIHFIKKLFAMYPLRKIYSTIYQYNEESLKSNLAAGFSIEGKLKDYRYYDGEYYDMYFLSLSREKFETTLGKLVI